MAYRREDSQSSFQNSPCEGTASIADHARMHTLLAMVDEPEHLPHPPTRQPSATPTLFEQPMDTRSSLATARNSVNLMNEKQFDAGSEQVLRERHPHVCSKCKAVDRDLEAALETLQIIPPQEDSKIVTWDGPDDPQSPKNWPKRKKWMIVISTGLMTFCVSFASSVFSTTTFVTAELFGSSSEVMILGLSLYVLGFAFGQYPVWAVIWPKSLF